MQLTRLKQLGHDVRPTHELALDVELRNGRPVGEIFDGLAYFVIFEHIDGDKVTNAAGLEDLDRPARKAALGNWAVPFMNSTTGLSVTVFAMNSLASMVASNDAVIGIPSPPH